MEIAKRVFLQLKTYPRLFNSLFILNAFAVLFYTIWSTIWKGQMGYTIGETLMNYQFGFYRRALVGNFFILLPTKSSVLMAITLAYCMCLIIPLLILQNGAKRLASWLPWVCVIVVFYSPFGVAFYMKDPPAIRKELFFFLLFFFLVLYKNKYDGAINSLVATFILIASLIHESFFFLFFPFLLCYLWLNDWVNKKWLLIHFTFGVIITLLLLQLQGNTEHILEKFMQQYRNLGFGNEQFTAFEYFQKLPASENIEYAFHHFTDVTPFIYIAVYIGHFCFLFLLFRYVGLQFLFKKPTELLLSLGIIGVMVVGLCLIAMDYGRWFSLAYVTSIILITTQIKSIKVNMFHRPPVLTLLISIVTVGLVVLLRIPHFTVILFDVDEWVLVFRPLIKNSIFFSITVIGIAGLLEYFNRNVKSVV